MTYKISFLNNEIRISLKGKIENINQFQEVLTSTIKKYPNAKGLKFSVTNFNEVII